MSDIVPTKAFWFRIGYALERTRQTVAMRARPDSEHTEAEAIAAEGSIPGPRQPSRRASRGRTGAGPLGLKRPLVRDPLLEAGTAWFERQVVSRFLGSKSPSRFGLARGALAGAAAEIAAIAVHAALVGPAKEGSMGQTDGAAALLEGAAEGIVYASLFRPVVPGPTWARGTAFGVARYFAARGGGLPQVLGSLSPHRRVPGLDAVIAPRSGNDDTLWEHVVAGIVLSVVYESSDLRSGTIPDGSD